VCMYVYIFTYECMYVCMYQFFFVCVRVPHSLRPASSPHIIRRRKFVAGSCGPYGAMLGGGQEYSGDYGPECDEYFLFEFHLERARELWRSGCDVLLFETIPRLAEVRAVLRVLDRLADAHTAGAQVHSQQPIAFVSLQCSGPETLASGESVTEACALLRDYACVLAVGCNCVSTAIATDTLRVLHACAPSMPLLVYPNLGNVWDHEARVWRPRDAAVDMRSLLQSWVSLGVRVVGGCCGAGPEHIAALSAAVTEMVEERGGEE
jgi:homocysteine S-methyltransferase